MDDHLARLSPDERSELERIVSAFEDAWAERSTPSLAEFLPAAGSVRRAAFLELVVVDLELRRKRRCAVSAELYVKQFPELIDSEFWSLVGAAHPSADQPPRSSHSLPANPPASQGGDSGKRLTFRLNCPHCHEPIAVSANANDSDAVCPCCGSSFPLAGDNSETWQPERLPKLGKFELLNLLGRGSFGAVYRARDTELKRLVAVKLPRSGSFSTGEDEDRFIREARSAAQLQHPGIVRVYEVGRSELVPYIVSEFVDGVTLAEYLTTQELGLREAAQLVSEIAAALDHAHRQGIVHRDLKPSNVMLERSTEEDSHANESLPEPRDRRAARRVRRFKPRLMDFGLARREGEDVTLAIEGQPLGTPAYMSPEQARGDGGRADGRSDIYSLGVILYRLLAGELPFRGNARMLMQQVQYDEPAPPRKLNDRIPRDLQTICLKAMAKNPRHRYATAGEFGADLRRFLAGEPIQARPVSRFEHAWRWCARNRAAAGLIASLALALGAVSVAGWIAWRHHQSQQLQSLLARLDHKLDRPADSAEYLEDVHLLLDDIQRLDAQEARERTARFESRYEQHLRGEMSVDRLTRPRIAALRATLDAWSVRHPESAASLFAELARRDDQQALFDLAARDERSDEELRRVFAGQVERRDGQFARQEPKTTAAENPADELLLTAVPSPRSAELELSFGPTWSQASTLGVALGCSGPRRRDAQYAVLLRAGDDSAPAGSGAAAAPPTFEASRNSGQSFFLELWRGERRIKRFVIQSQAIERGPLRLWVQRLGNQFQLQVNRLPQARFVEIFSAPAATEGRIGLVWPSVATVERLAAYQYKLTEQSNARQRADELAATGASEQALELYQRLASQAPDDRTRDELRLRQAICLAELGRRDESEQMFGELSGAADEQTALAARLRLWYSLVVAGEVLSESADAVFKSLASSHSFGDVAALLPDDVRERLLAAYYNAAPYTGYGTVRPYPNRVRDFERLLRVLELVQAQGRQITTAQFALMLAYHQDERLADAIAMAERLLQNPIVVRSPQDHSLVLQEYVHLLLRAKRLDEARALIDRVLAAHAQNPLPYSMLRVQRARVDAARGEWRQAADELTQLLAEPRLTFASAPETYCTALLVAGFVEEELGRPEEAQRLWRQGMAACRAERQINISLFTSLFGSLTNDFTADDTTQTVNQVVAQSKDSPVLNFLAQSFVPTDLVTAILRNLWRGPRGRDAARRLAFLQATYAELGHMQVLLTGFEMCRQAVQNSFELEPPLTPSEDRVMWQACEELFRQYSNRSVSEMNVVQLALTWQGNPGLLGWGAVSRQLEPHCRAAFAFVFGCHYARLKRLPEAQKFWREAIELAGDDNELRDLAQRRLAASESAAPPKPE